MGWDSVGSYEDGVNNDEAWQGPGQALVLKVGNLLNQLFDLVLLQEGE